MGFELVALIFLSVAFVAGGSMICFYTFTMIWKKGPYYHPVRNPKGLPRYKSRIDTKDIPVEHSHGHQEPHV